MNIEVVDVLLFVLVSLVVVIGLIEAWQTGYVRGHGDGYEMGVMDGMEDMDKRYRKAMCETFGRGYRISKVCDSCPNKRECMKMLTGTEGEEGK